VHREDGSPKTSSFRYGAQTLHRLYVVYVISGIYVTFVSVQSCRPDIMPIYNSSLLTPSMLTSSVSKIKTLLAGMGPAPLLPYAHSGWMVNFLFSPGHMSSRPWSQPLMTWPLPTLKLRGWPRL
jgi:hypothetical protein